ncbi:hypothetical protein JG688_00006734 [Phytophthora aleatoria]|uniref:Transmembrane protein n=1 Tax=Phytophthora aleatoria TaxID=2496075 RepID=A0A8J5M8N0_9STRA|nr:hypothetical protein JG688_00006734 [Phytophthora aleatoria]
MATLVSMGTSEDEAEVEALLQQIALAKQKELRLRAEKSRIRDELGQLQAGTLWSREEQTQKKLVEVRRAKELLETQKKTEEEKLVKLSDNLKEKKAPLQLEDFDDVLYKMEIVRLGDDTNDQADDRVALLESIFLGLLCMLLLGGCVAVGFATHLIEYSREVLSWLLPMLLLPLAWVVALFVWERSAIAMQSKIATQ